MLGKREADIYGTATLDEIEKLCQQAAQKHGFQIDFRQSNYEGELVTWIQDAYHQSDGIIINAAAYTHTSIAIHDALKILECPIIEVHISDPKEREGFRRISFVEPLAQHCIAGKGVQGYIDALTFLSNHYK